MKEVYRIMFRYVQSEWLKTKSLGIMRQNLLFLFFAGIITIGFSFTSLNNNAVASLFNWLSFLLINLLIPIIVHTIYNHEKRSTDFKNLQIPKNNRSYEWFSKMLVITFYYASFLILFSGLALGINLLFPYTSGVVICLSTMLIFVTSLWQVPFVLFLERKSNFLITLIINFIFGTLLTVFFGDGDLYKVIPWTWPSRAIMPTLNVSISGSIIDQNDPMIVSTNSSYLVIAAVILGIVLSLLFIDRKGVKHEKKYPTNEGRKFFTKA